MVGEPLAVTWRAFELDPSAPREAPTEVDYIERLARKYRTSSDGARAMIDRMVEAGATVDIDFRFDRARPCNTFDAHRLLAWARTTDRQDALAERLFSAYMTEGLALTDREILVGLAADCDLDADAARAVLASDAHADEVRLEERQAVRLGVTGVPFFVFADRYAAGGAQPPEVLGEILERVRAETPEVIPGAAAAAACGPDGCD